jgi:lipopolysaccharide export LptBFGC system permease protein LptF
VLVTGYFAVLKVVVVCALRVSSTTPDERQALSRTLAWSVGSMAAISTLLTLPPLLSYSLHSWDAAIAVVPQALPLAIPMGIAIGIAFGLSARPAVNIVKVTVLGAVVASVLSFAVLAWVMPAANQAFREMTIRELADRGYKVTFGPHKGHNEMTLSELRSEEASFAAASQTRIPRQFAFTFHLRFALAASTLVLATLLLAVPFHHRGLRGLTAFAAFFLYWALMNTGEAFAVDSAAALSLARTVLPFIGAWLPNIVIGALAVVIAFSRFSRPRGSLNPAQ